LAVSETLEIHFILTLLTVPENLILSRRLEGMESERVEWIELAQDWVQWRGPVKDAQFPDS
jgi:hypothetical protein